MQSTLEFGGNGDPWRADGNLGVLPKRSQPPLRLYGERVAVIFDYTHHPDVHASRSGGRGILENGIVMAFIQSQREMVDRLTVDVERNSFADGGRDVVGGDAHVSGHHLAGDPVEAQSLAVIRLDFFGCPA